jgi:hypothetical protein
MGVIFTASGRQAAVLVEIRSLLDEVWKAGRAVLRHSDPTAGGHEDPNKILPTNVKIPQTKTQTKLPL